MSIFSPSPAIGTAYCHSPLLFSSFSCWRKGKLRAKESLLTGYEGNPFSFYVVNIFKSKSVKLSPYNIQSHLVKNSNLLHAEVELCLHYCNNRAMSSQKMPSRRLKVKAKFHTYVPTQRCCSISVWVWHVLEVKEVRRGFPPPHFSSLSGVGKQWKKCCYTWGTQELSQALWYGIPASLQTFLLFGVNIKP